MGKGWQASKNWYAQAVAAQKLASKMWAEQQDLKLEAEWAAKHAKALKLAELKAQELEEKAKAWATMKSTWATVADHTAWKVFYGDWSMTVTSEPPAQDESFNPKPEIDGYFE